MARPPIWRKKEIRFVLRLTLNGIANDEIIRAFNASFSSFQLNSKKIKYVRATYGRDPAFGAPLTTGKLPWDPDDSYGDDLDCHSPFNPHTYHLQHASASAPAPNDNDNNNTVASSSQQQVAHPPGVDDTPVHPQDLASLGDLAQLLAFNQGHASANSTGPGPDAGAPSQTCPPSPGAVETQVQMSASALPTGLPSSDNIVSQHKSDLAPSCVGAPTDDWLVFPPSSSSSSSSSSSGIRHDGDSAELQPGFEASLAWDGGAFGLGAARGFCEHVETTSLDVEHALEAPPRGAGGDATSAYTSVHPALDADYYHTTPISLDESRARRNMAWHDAQPFQISATRDTDSGLISCQLTPPCLVLPRLGHRHVITACEKEVALAMINVRSLELKLMAARKQLGVAEAALRMERFVVKGHR